MPLPSITNTILPVELHTPRHRIRTALRPTEAGSYVDVLQPNQSRLCLLLLGLALGERPTHVLHPNPVPKPTNLKGNTQPTIDGFL